MPGEKIDLYKAFYPAFRFALNRKFDISVQGQENIPDEPAIFAANHIMFEDSALIAMAYTEAKAKPLRFAAKQEYFDGHGIDGNGKWGRSMKLLMEHSLMIPVDRENIDFAAFMRDMSAALQRDESVAIHPEATRIDDGKIYRFRLGMALIAMHNSVPALPTGVVYSDYSNGKKTHVDISFGKPMHPSDFSSPELNATRTAMQFTQAVEDQVAVLTGMEQSGQFAKLRKQRGLGETDGK